MCKHIEKHVPQKISIGIKCGISTGYTTIDYIGTKKRAQYTAIGNTVNIASRLTDISHSDQIIVSPSTKLKIANQIELRRTTKYEIYLDHSFISMSDGNCKICVAVRMYMYGCFN